MVDFYEFLRGAGHKVINCPENIVRFLGLAFQGENTIHDTLKEQRRCRRLPFDRPFDALSQNRTVQVYWIYIQLTGAQDAEIGHLSPVGKKALQIQHLLVVRIS